MDINGYEWIQNWMVSTPVEQNLRCPCHPRKIWRPGIAQDYRVSIGRIDQGNAESTEGDGMG